VDSVNAVAWQPFSNNVCTGSGDKTVSLWDARSGLCVQTFYGHLNAVSTIALTVYVCV
jgi:WD40 repeat protein